MCSTVVKHNPIIDAKVKPAAKPLGRVSFPARQDLQEISRPGARGALVNNRVLFLGIQMAILPKPDGGYSSLLKWAQHENGD